MLRDTRLSSLAIDSAISIDKHLRGKAEENDYDSVMALAQEIQEYSGSYLDLTKRVMFAELIWPNKEDWRGKTQEEVNLQLHLLSKDLYCFRELSRKSQEGLMKACTDLCEKSMHYLDRYYRLGLAA